MATAQQPSTPTADQAGQPGGNLARLRLGRRGFVAGLAVSLAAPAVLRAQPTARPGKVAPQSVSAILQRSKLAAQSGFALMDLGSGQLLESHQADAGRPPASVAKIPTALFALETLGANYTFATRLIGTGPIEAGVLRGDLVLAGTGDPVLDTDALGDLAAALSERGVRSVAGRFLVETGALPGLREIDASQPEHAGYNPAISGINLNFNRVHMEWATGDQGLGVAFVAPGQRYNVRVPSIRAEIADGGLAPAHRVVDGREVWVVPRGALGSRGARWLPVREPAGYAGRVFCALAAGMGADVPGPEAVASAPEGDVLAERQSQSLEAMMRGMLRYSTNLTAEVAGLRAAQAHGADPAALSGSAGVMTDWMRLSFGLERAGFVNHSGLTDRSLISPAETVRMLRVAERETNLRDLMRERSIRDKRREPVDFPGVRVRAKTGTLYFASALAGYMEGAGGRLLAFAIFSADMNQRAGIPPDLHGAPAGAKAWSRRARGQQHALLRRWAGQYAG